MLDYPDSLRRAMVEQHLGFAPSWIYDGMGRERGDLVVFYEYVLATMRNVVGVLAGLNRVYVAPDKLKRIGAVVGRMELVPPDAARRLDTLLGLPREQVRAELDDLVGATLDLVDEHLPEVDTARARVGWSRAASRPTASAASSASALSPVSASSSGRRPCRGGAEASASAPGSPGQARGCGGSAPAP